MINNTSSLWESSANRSTQHMLILGDEIKLPIHEGGEVLEFSDGRRVSYDHESSLISLEGLHEPTGTEWDHFCAEWEGRIEELGCGLDRAMSLIAEALPMFYGKRIYEEPRTAIQNDKVDAVISLYCMEVLTSGARPTTSVDANKPQAVPFIGALILAKKFLDTPSK